jgi:hypothetical protein
MIPGFPIEGVIFSYEGLSSLDDILATTNRKVLRVHMNHDDLIALTDDVFREGGTFKYFSLMSTTDYIEFVDGEETEGNNVSRNEVKFIFKDKTLEIEVFDVNG